MVDCAAVLQAVELDRVVAAALVSPHVRLQTLQERVLAGSGRPGAPALREVLHVSEMAVTRSEAERLLRRAILEARLDRPTFNVRVLGRERDAVWPELQLVVEVQGYRFHSDPRQFEHDHQRGLELAAAGWLHVPVSYRMLRFHRLPTMAGLAAVLARRALELGAAEATAMDTVGSRTGMSTTVAS